MFSAPFVFSGYAIVGLTLLTLAASVSIYLLRLQEKTKATWAMIAFFIMAALSGAMMILTNAFLYWDRFFVTWQDFWVLAGGVALVYFAYSIPHFEPSREARAFLVVAGSLVLLALLYSLVFDYLFVFHWTPELDVNDAYYFLLPAGTLLIVYIFLRRSLQLSAQSAPTTISSQSPDIITRLIHPQGEEARALRNLGLALSLAFLPGLQTLLRLPGPYGFILSNIGALLAIISIALVYFNYAPEIDSFIAKLVGITLSTVLMIISIFGAVDVNLASDNYAAQIRQIVVSVHDSLVRTGNMAFYPQQVAYVASWDAARPADAASYQLLYRSADAADFDLDSLIEENQEGYLERQSQPVTGVLIENTGREWLHLWRYRILPFDRAQDEYNSFIFFNKGNAYEIAFYQLRYEEYISGIVSKWMILILIATLFILLVFPLFFRRTLVRPLDDLLNGIRQVNRGDLDIFVPIRFHDEIGSLTESFNKLTRSLRMSQAQQEELFSRLQASYDDLEERVADRTRELSAFTDLTMLPGGHDDLTEILQPALNRIMEVGLCQTLCVHLLAEDRLTMSLVAQRNLPATAVDMLQELPVSTSFAGRMQRADDPLLSGLSIESADLPRALMIGEDQNYLGCPLMAGDQSHGWLSCYRREEDDFTVGEISLLIALARQMGVIVENQRLRQRIKDVAVLEERQRLARDLHDSVTQLVFSMTLFTRSSQEALEDGDTDRLAVNLSRMAEVSLQALRDMRFMLFELQPPVLEIEGLAKALNARFNMVERRVGVEVDATIEETIESKEIEREIYYVAIEALNNTLKHASADHVDLAVKRENGSLYFCATDNGRGFDPSQVSAGLGINNMRRRIEDLGGSLQIDSAINEGTIVVARVPLTEQKRGG